MTKAKEPEYLPGDIALYFHYENGEWKDHVCCVVDYMAFTSARWGRAGVEFLKAAGWGPTGYTYKISYDDTVKEVDAKSLRALTHWKKTR